MGYHGVAGDEEVFTGLGDTLDDGLETPRVAVGVIDRRSFGCDEDQPDDALVLVRCEFGGEAHEQRVAGCSHPEAEQEDQWPRAQCGAEKATVATVHPCQPALDQTVTPAVLCTVGGKHARAHHRRKRQSDEAGDDHRTCECPRELGEQASGRPRHESNGHVDRDQGQRHRDDRKANLAAARQRRLAG